MPDPIFIEEIKQGPAEFKDYGKGIEEHIAATMGTLEVLNSAHGTALTYTVQGHTRYHVVERIVNRGDAAGLQRAKRWVACCAMIATSSDPIAIAELQKRIDDMRTADALGIEVPS